jgi:putative IMPACT (imprinted ancient) family translation regulator
MLGVPGLIHAYKTTAKDALLLAPSIIKEETQTFELEFDYHLTSIINQAIIKLDAIQQGTENLLFCKKQIQIPVSNVEEANQIFSKIHNLVFRKL